MATDEILNLSKSNTSFGLDLFKKLASERKGENVFFSPYSISCALAMTSLGARNETLNQLRKAMKLDDIPQEEIHKMFAELNKLILDNGQKITLHVANRLYGEKSYNFLEDFLENCKKYYEAELAPMDFKNSAAGAVKVINEWVNGKTGGKIKDLLNESSVDSLTRLIIVNAIYFKGDWHQKFDPKLTKEADFHVSANESVKVQMMFMKKASHLYGEDDELCCQFIELPYIGESLSMVIILPDLSKTTLDNLEGQLTTDLMLNLQLHSKEIFAWIPKFKLELDINLNKLLQGLGIINLFDDGLADLSGMNGQKDLHVSESIHKAFIEINEEGSEAAAATAMVFKTRCAHPVHVPEFKADHPFIFFIKDCTSKSILFYGRLIKP